MCKNPTVFLEFYKGLGFRVGAGGDIIVAAAAVSPSSPSLVVIVIVPCGITTEVPFLNYKMSEDGAWITFLLQDSAAMLSSRVS